MRYFFYNRFRLREGADVLVLHHSPPPSRTLVLSIWNRSKIDLPAVQKQKTRRGETLLKTSEHHGNQESLSLSYFSRPPLFSRIIFTESLGKWFGVTNQGALAPLCLQSGQHTGREVLWWWGEQPAIWHEHDVQMSLENQRILKSQHKSEVMLCSYALYFVLRSHHCSFQQHNVRFPLQVSSHLVIHSVESILGLSVWMSSL